MQSKLPLVQECAQVPLLSVAVPEGHASAQVPPAQRPLQQSVLPVQLTPLDVHAAAQMLPSHLPLQHCLFFLHFFPVRLHSSSATATPPTPNEASVPPRRAAPINLSALPRESLPLASPLASSSKDLSVVPVAIRCLLTNVVAIPLDHPHRTNIGKHYPTVRVGLTNRIPRF
jgi:hypothetical protein